MGVPKLGRELGVLSHVVRTGGRANALTGDRANALTSGRAGGAGRAAMRYLKSEFHLDEKSGLLQSSLVR